MSINMSEKKTSLTELGQAYIMFIIFTRQLKLHH